MSALKQYGFLKGDAKSSFSADELAKRISAAPPEELAPLYRQAILRPTIFRKLFDTFHGDTWSKAKLKQRAADLKVHPDETATCIDLYVAGMTTAGLVTVEGDQVSHLAASSVSTVGGAGSDADSEPAGEQGSGSDLSGDEASTGSDLNSSGNGSTDEVKAAKPLPNGAAQSGPRAVFNVNVTLDSSLDIEKLQKQLELLKRFGAI